MVETTPPDPSVSTPPTPPPAAGAEAAAERPVGPPTVRELLEAGVHFGHQTRRWNPRMKPFLFGERNGIHIVDLDQTLVRLRAALDFVRETVAAGGKVLFVGTKRQAAPSMQLEAERAEQFYVNNRWLGGMLTNFRTVKKSIERFKSLLEVLEDEEKLKDLSKKERSRLSREVDRYSKAFDGIREMTRLPDALFVIDVSREHIAIQEARRLVIPIVAVVDSNCDPLGIDYVIPGNDDAIRAIQLYSARVADACLEGAVLCEERIQAQVAQEATGREAAAAAPASGRVVVEIKQPPRRGRGAGGAGRSAGGRRGPRSGEEPGAEAKAKAAPAEVKAGPGEAKAGPGKVKAGPGEAKADPGEVRPDGDPGGGS